MHKYFLQIVAISISLAAPYLWATCPKTTPNVCACTTDVASCGGFLHPLGGCSKRSDVSVGNGPFACAATGVDTECVDGTADQKKYCFIRYAWKKTPDKGCVANGAIVTEVENRVIKIGKACGFATKI